MSPRLTAFLLLSLFAVNVTAERPEKPNIILILVDDLGWQDVGCYDIDEPTPMETPNIDKLAKKGVKFLSGYSPSPTCAPTRCAILSGNHPARAQKTHVVGGHPPVPHHVSHPMMPPWYSGRMPEDTYSLGVAMQDAGYVTGHAGKWHIAISHAAFPQPKDCGFDFTQSNLGTTKKMSPNRLTGFATDKTDDPYRIDKNGYTTHQNSLDAIGFVADNKDKAFFLYYCTWLVHTPIHTRNKALLDKYVKKLGVTLPVDDPESWTGEGQTNPFYCAMVEELDYYAGQLFDYLENTEDPRWPGHKLNENTYVVFTSDNGGMEKHPGEIITDNYPLDRGKISAMEGGTRVPFIVVGPNIPAGVESDVLVNGLDFYPTFLAWAGGEIPKDKNIDGCDLSSLLMHGPEDASLVRHADGSVRDSMMWHFPNSIALESTLRVGDYKLVRNYNHVMDQKTVELELYQLYNTVDGKSERVDIEEAKNLVDAMPEKAAAMNAELTRRLESMDASYPYYNPDTKFPVPNKEKVCEVLSHEQNGAVVSFNYKSNGAKIKRADLMYTLNGGEKYEEWFRKKGVTLNDTEVKAKLPEGTTHYVINLIDENQFLRSYPELMDQGKLRQLKKKYSELALKSN